MLYATRPTHAELQELERLTRQQVGQVSQRAQMILLSIRRETVPEIADLLEARCATARFWIKRFNAEGPVGLYDRERSGRPPRSTDPVKDTIVQMIRDNPRQEGYLTGLHPTWLSWLEFERCNVIVECRRQKSSLQTRLAGDADRWAAVMSQE